MLQSELQREWAWKGWYKRRAAKTCSLCATTTSGGSANHPGLSKRPSQPVENRPKVKTKSIKGMRSTFFKLILNWKFFQMSDPSYSAWISHGANMTVVDKALPDMLHLIDPHWYKFPPMNPLWHGLLGFVIGVLGVISFCGNGMVLYIFGTTKSLRSPSNLLVMNLALSDFLMMIVMSPPMVINCFYETWVFGRWLFNFPTN